MDFQLEQGLCQLGTDGMSGTAGNDDRLANKVVLVTGASRNIGGVLASGLAVAGARVACNDLDAAVAEQRADLINGAGGQAVAVPFDVTDSTAAISAVEKVVAQWGRIDALVNNAVTFDHGGLLDMTVERFRKQVDVILAGSFIMSQAVARTMITNGHGGAIVNILSTAAWQGEAGNVGYSTAKAGMANFTRASAMDLAPHGIRVNSLTPTVTMPDDPELMAGAEAYFAAVASTGTIDFAGQMPWSRIPTPTDYVGPLIFLLSQEASMMTGTNITVDGGALAKYWPQRPTRV
jgi:NAD(P)-dependent dehydrogenase (short-subunit alcohol dehydrogenase family)